MSGEDLADEEDHDKEEDVVNGLKQALQVFLALRGVAEHVHRYPVQHFHFTDCTITRDTGHRSSGAHPPLLMVCVCVCVCEKSVSLCAVGEYR